MNIARTIRSGHRSCKAGFTLLELTIVLMIMSILIAIAVPNYQRAIVQSKESTLKQDLASLRSAIQQYTMDKQRAPQTLEDLVSGGYMRAIPKDPMTGKEDTWKVDMEDSLMAVDQNQPGIVDVHSGASGTATDGTSYDSW